jgi:hypothetical protein
LISSNTLVNNAEVEKVVDPYCKDGASISIGNSQMLEIPSVVDQVSSNSLRSTLLMNQSSANNSSISKSKPSVTSVNSNYISHRLRSSSNVSYKFIVIRIYIYNYNYHYYYY